MDAREQQSNAAISKMILSLDDALKSMTLSSHDSAVDAIKSAFVDWWMEHDIESKERYGNQND